MYIWEHGTALVDAGWTEHEWFKRGYLTGGMGNVSKTGTHQMDRERIWASPNCLRPGETNPSGQYSLFDEDSE